MEWLIVSETSYESWPSYVKSVEMILWEITFLVHIQICMLQTPGKIANSMLIFITRLIASITLMTNLLLSLEISQRSVLSVVIALKCIILVDALHPDKGRWVMYRRVFKRIIEKVVTLFPKAWQPYLCLKNVSKNLWLNADEENDCVHDCVGKVGRHADTTRNQAATLIQLKTKVSTTKVGNIVSSAVTCQPTLLQIAIRVLPSTNMVPAYLEVLISWGDSEGLLLSSLQKRVSNKPDWVLPLREAKYK